MSNTDASGEKRVTGTSERREQIIQRLRQQGSVQVNDLSALYGVSTVTIRNDLAFLEKQGIAVRAYGGALICDSTTPSVEPSVEDKSALNTAMKRSVAKAAVELIQPGHRVILDSGTTTFEIARLMRKHTDVIAMTNGMNVANALLEAEGVELLMTGGHLRRQSQSFYGDQAEQSLQSDLHTGILTGGTLELVWMGLAPLAGAQPPNVIIGTIVGTAFAITTGVKPDVAVGVAVPFAVAVHGIVVDAHQHTGVLKGGDTTGGPI